MPIAARQLQHHFSCSMNIVAEAQEQSRISPGLVLDLLHYTKDQFQGAQQYQKVHALGICTAVSTNLQGNLTVPKLL